MRTGDNNGTASICPVRCCPRGSGRGADSAEKNSMRPVPKEGGPPTVRRCSRVPGGGTDSGETPMSRSRTHGSHRQCHVTPTRRRARARAVVEGTVLPGSPSITRSDDHRVLTGTGRPLPGRTHGLRRTWARRVSGSSVPLLLVVPVTPTGCAAQPTPDRPPVCRTLPERPGHWGRGYPVDEPLLACVADASPPAASPLSPGWHAGPDWDKGSCTGCGAPDTRG